VTNRNKFEKLFLTTTSPPSHYPTESPKLLTSHISTPTYQEAYKAVFKYIFQKYF